MPEISRFYGIIIRMFMEPVTKHNRPHFHAYYQGKVGVIAIDEVELIAGYLAKGQRILVMTWAEFHQTELLDDWRLLQSGNPTH